MPFVHQIHARTLETDEAVYFTFIGKKENPIFATHQLELQAGKLFTRLSTNLNVFFFFNLRYLQSGKVLQTLFNGRMSLEFSQKTS